jgi:hypothetical protein
MSRLCHINFFSKRKDAEFFLVFKKGKQIYLKAGAVVA